MHLQPAVRLLTASFLLAAVASSSLARQDAFDVRELAGYRLTPSVFAQFEHASRLISRATRADTGLAEQPLFTREIALSDDVLAAAAALNTRLTSHGALNTALFAAQISAREYTKFAIALIAAHLAREFLATGALGGVPPGVTADNVAFVDGHASEVSAVLANLGVLD